MTWHVLPLIYIARSIFLSSFFLLLSLKFSFSLSLSLFFFFHRVNDHDIDTEKKDRTFSVWEVNRSKIRIDVFSVFLRKLFWKLIRTKLMISFSFFRSGRIRLNNIHLFSSKPRRNNKRSISQCSKRSIIYAYLLREMNQT